MTLIFDDWPDLLKDLFDLFKDLLWCAPRSGLDMEHDVQVVIVFFLLVDPP